MELGLSLGHASKVPPAFRFSKENKTTHKQKINGAGLDICMALGIKSSPVVNGQEQQKSQENGGGDDDDDHSQTSNDHVHQLNLLPLVPVNPFRSNISTHLQSSGSSEIGSSGNVGPLAAKGFDVNRLPADEVSSSANSVGPRPPFGMIDLAITYDRSNLLVNNIGRNKKRSHLEESATGNDVVEAERASSRASDDDDVINGLNSTRKKLRLSKEQSAFLEESFKEHSTLNPKQKQALARQLNLRPRQVEVWFQNRRARTKLKQTEVDCEYLKRCCETLTEENRRLHKELQELRALKTCNPFHTQPPATTLTMCPSCERVATTTTTTNANAPPPSSSTTGNTADPIPFPLNRPRFYPLSQTAPVTRLNQPAAPS